MNNLFLNLQNKNNQLDLVSRIEKDLKIGPIRTSLNKFNSAFSDETQRGTDRLIRVIIQDISELEKDAPIKAGKVRSEIKVTKGR